MIQLKELKIDEDFKILIPPLTKKEFLQLEENLLSDGCINPIITWNGYIVDGHNRYSICTKHKIPFKTKELEFEDKYQIVIWICKNQLGRRNISEESRKYLIGKLYSSLKIINKNKNPNGYNQHKKNFDDKLIDSARHTTASKIGKDNHINCGTVYKYEIFSKAIDEIGEKAPKLLPKILSGTIKISQKNLLDLAKLPTHEIKQIDTQMENFNKSFIPYSQARNILAQSVQEPHKPSVKDMPEFDPDANYIKLALTIPSWINIINNTILSTNISIVSASAKINLSNVLNDLQITTNTLLNAIKEENNV